MNFTRKIKEILIIKNSIFLHYKLPIKIGFKVIIEVFLLMSAHYDFYACILKANYQDN